jgi:hypothetical protein
MSNSSASLREVNPVITYGPVHPNNNPNHRNPAAALRNEVRRAEQEYNSLNTRGNLNEYGQKAKEEAWDWVMSARRRLAAIEKEKNGRVKGRRGQRLTRAQRRKRFQNQQKHKGAGRTRKSRKYI